MLPIHLPPSPFITYFISVPGTSSLPPSCHDMQQCESDCRLAPRGMCADEMKAQAPPQRKLKWVGGRNPLPQGSVKRHNTLTHATPLVISLTVAPVLLHLILHTSLQAILLTLILLYIKPAYFHPHEIGGRSLFAFIYLHISCNCQGGRAFVAISTHNATRCLIS